MPGRYDKRQIAEGRWEVIDTVSGGVIRMGGMLLSGLDLDSAGGALSVLNTQVVQPDDTAPEAVAEEADGDTP